MQAVLIKESAVSASNIIWLRNSFLAVVSRPMRKKPTTAASGPLQGRGNCRKGKSKKEKGKGRSGLKGFRFQVFNYFLDNLFMSQVAAVDYNIRPFLI
jgi:hypothetical protein